MKRWIRNFLGIPESFEGRLTRLERESEHHTLQQSKIMCGQQAIADRLDGFKTQVNVHSRSLGAILGRLEPKLTLQEDDLTSPAGRARKAESDAIADAVIKRLTGEASS